MKYTNLIINGNIDVEGIVSDKIVLKPFTIIIAITVSVVGVIILAGALPIAGVADGGRYMKLQYYHYAKVQRHKRYIEEVLISLSVLKKEMKSYILQLEIR